MDEQTKPKKRPEPKPEPEPKQEKAERPRLTAKKAFKIVHNNYVRDIQPGDDVSDIPEIYLSNLKTEEVI